MRKSAKLSKVCGVPAGSPQNRSGGVGSDAGVPRAFDTFLKGGVLGYVIKDLLLSKKYRIYMDNNILCVKIIQWFHFYITF